MWQIISDGIGIFLFCLCEVVFVQMVLNKKIEPKTSITIIILIITSIMCMWINATAVGTTKAILIYTIHILEYKKLFKLSYSKSIFLTFIYMILIMIIEIIVLLLVTNIIGMSKFNYYDKVAGNILGNLLTGVLLIAIAYIFKKKLRKLINASLENNTKIIIYSIFTFICSAMFLYTIIKEFRISNDIFLYLASIVVLLTVLFSLIKQTLENNKLTNEYDKLLEFMTTYENEIENQRILRHEVKNEFRTIRAKICDKQENKEIIEYIDEIVKDKYEVNKEKYAKFGYLPPNGIKGLFYFKTQEAEKRNINVAINISKKVKDSIIYNLTVKQQRDFGRIIGVFLDNAIEASLESEKKQLGIEAYINLESEFKLIISNTFNNKIEELKIGKEKFSTKGKNRGHGLLLVKQLVEKNNIFEIKTDIQEELYIQIITVKKL